MIHPGHEGMARVQDWVTEAVRLDQAGRFSEALACFRQAAELAPHHPHVLHNLSLALVRNGHGGEALKVARRVIQLNPGHVPGALHLAELLRATEALDEAEAVLRQCLDVLTSEGGGAREGRGRGSQPDRALLHNAWGLVSKAKGELDRAVVHLREARVLDPGHREAGLNLAVSLREQGDLVEALAVHRAVLAEGPADAAAHLAYAHTLLMAGDYGRGWEEHEWRLRTPELAGIFRDLKGPRWSGGNLAGGRLLVVAEQGYGDVIMFSRFLPEIRRRGGRVVLQCRQALHRLMLGSGLADEVLDVEPSKHQRPGMAAGASGAGAGAAFAGWVPLLSLPWVLGAGASALKGEWAYLNDASHEASACREASVRTARIGLVWRGNSRPDPRRSIPTDQLCFFAAVAGVTFVCLQPDLPEEELALARGLGLEIETWGGGDFADAAGAVRGCDLVITIDTAMAHLAGAMGSTTWVLLPRGPDWRWGHQGGTTPWYGRVRLFRERAKAGWRETVSEVAQALAAWKKERDQGSSFAGICR